MLIDTLSRTSLFSELTLTDLEEIAKFSQAINYEDGEELIHENDEDNRDIFVLCHGSLEVVSNNVEDVSSEEAVISNEIQEVFGEIAWLTHRKRTATVRCYGPVKVIRVNGLMLDGFIEANPRAGYFIMQQIAINLSSSLTQTSDLLKQILWSHSI